MKMDMTNIEFPMILRFFVFPNLEKIIPTPVPTIPSIINAMFMSIFFNIMQEHDIDITEMANNT